MAGDAVDDARRNALNNKISNAYFIPGPAEDMIPQMIGQASHDEIVAVLDPPRTGLHMKAIRQIRASRIKKVVYVSSDPKSCIKNFVDLARPSSTTFFGDPFLPVLVRPLDLLPHTNHFPSLTSCILTGPPRIRGGSPGQRSPGPGPPPPRELTPSQCPDSQPSSRAG